MTARRLFFRIDLRPASERGGLGQRRDHAESGWENLGALCGQHRLQGAAGVSGYKAGTSFGADESQGEVRCPGVQSHGLPESEG